MDKTFIKNLLVQGIIGISEKERSQKQDILINITLFGDIHAAAKSDSIADCINYRTVAKKTIAFIEYNSRQTVEALASDIARLALEEPGVQKVVVRVEKPGAVRFAESVGVEIERDHSQITTTHQAYLSLGSNIQPEENILKALYLLKDKCTIHAVSSIWETEASGTIGPSFLNASVWISTELDAAALKQEIISPIETSLGRRRTEDKYAPRTIDLDILIFDEKVIDKNLWDKEFLAIPTAEIRPDFLHPDTLETLEKIVQALQVNSSAKQRLDLKFETFFGLIR